MKAFEREPLRANESMCSRLCASGILIFGLCASAFGFGFKNEMAVLGIDIHFGKIIQNVRRLLIQPANI